MDNFTLGLVTFFTIFAWLILGYVAYQAWGRRKQKPNPVIGYITSMTEDAAGLSVEFKINESEVGSNGIRTIKDAKISSVSLVANPGPGGGRVTHVEGKPV